MMPKERCLQVTASSFGSTEIEETALGSQTDRKCAVDISYLLPR